MIGKWDPWYRFAGPEPHAYGDTDSYRRGALFLARCPVVEDWGCGLGWMRQFIEPRSRYIGIDGSDSAHCDVVADLREYRSNTPGLFMRHVLEHNRDWAKVLHNAMVSFTDRMVLVLFTPISEITHEIAGMTGCGGIDVPSISFRNQDLTIMFGPGVRWLVEDMASPETWFGTERIYYLEKRHG